MIKNEEVEALLNDELKEIWKFIAENKIDLLLSHINSIEPKGTKGNFLSKIFNRKQSTKSNFFYQILKELLLENKSHTLDERQFSIEEKDSCHDFEKLIKLLFALRQNQYLTELKKYVSDKLLKSSKEIAEEISDKSNNYPQNSINAKVWIDGSIMRTHYLLLIDYFELEGNKNSQVWVQHMKTIITLSIMGHYKNEVGPDMIKAAQLEEELSNKEKALNHYEAVIADFEEELKYFLENIDVIPDENDIVILKSLSEAYEGAKRINKSQNFNENLSQINRILKL